MKYLVDEYVIYRPLELMQDNHRSDRPALPVEPRTLERRHDLTTIQNTSGSPLTVTARLTFKGVGLWMTDHKRSYANVRYHWRKKRFTTERPRMPEVAAMKLVLTQRAYAVPTASTRHLVTVPGMTMTKQIGLRAGQNVSIFAAMTAELDSSPGQAPAAADRHTLRHWHGVELHAQVWKDGPQ